MNFAKQGKNVTNPEGGFVNKGSDVPICSEEEWKLSWMRKTRIVIFMKMELEACRDELAWFNKMLFLRSQ